MKKLLSLLLALSLIGCVSLRPGEKEMARELQNYGVDLKEYGNKHPGMAGGLNVLPGAGNFYLAVGTGESDQWAIGFVNLLFWPISILWAIPEGAIDANTINTRATLDYYKFDRQGKKTLTKLRKENNYYDSRL